MPNIDLNYYHPINRQQVEFHASTAKHKLLIGGYGAGKSYPAIHESIFHCLDNPGHNFYVFRNTWESVEENIEADYLRICTDCGLKKNHIKDKHELKLINNLTIRFRPLTLGRAKFKGIHCCGFLIDDPDVKRFQDTISFLFSRLRNPPNVQAKKFISLITANLEGRDWLWTTYIKDRDPGGDGETAYWVCPTTDNPTLPPDYIRDMERVHSKEWVDRYIHCKLDAFIGLIYPNFNRMTHGISLEDIKKKANFANILAVDVGLSHASVILNLLTDGKAIYVAKEWYAKGIVSSKLAELVIEAREWSQETFKLPVSRMIIDPASAKKEQTSGISVREDLRRNYGLRFDSANNSVTYGIVSTQDLIMSAKGKIRLFLNVQDCPNTANEMEIYRWKEPREMDTDYMEYSNDPVKKRDDTVDTLRYGICFLKRQLDVTDEEIEKRMTETKLKNWQERFDKLRVYKEEPALMGMHLQQSRKLELSQTYKKLGFSKKKIKNLISGLN